MSLIRLISRVGISPYICNVFTWNNDTDQLEFTSTQSVPVTVTDFPYHSDAGNYTYPLYDNVWDDNGVSRYGAKGQIGGTLEYFNLSSNAYVSPRSCGGTPPLPRRCLCGLWRQCSLRSRRVSCASILF